MTISQYYNPNNILKTSQQRWDYTGSQFSHVKYVVWDYTGSRFSHVKYVVSGTDNS